MIIANVQIIVLQNSRFTFKQDYDPQDLFDVLNARWVPLQVM